MSRRTRSFLFDNVSGRLLTDVSLTLKQISDQVEGSGDVKTIAPIDDVKTALSVADTGGDGSLAYNSTSGVITYTGPSATEVRAHFSAGTGITITDGAVATTISQYTDALARAAVSVTDSGGDGSLAYNSTTGVITYTGPSASDVRAHFSAGTGIAITNGAISTSITQYTDTLARAAFSAGSGITITEGAIAVDSNIATKTYADNAATTAVSAAIDSSPETLNTLNELAAALGDDANFASSTSSALGNRLRVDVSDQSLSSTQQANALTNLGITATNTEINFIDGVTSAIQTQLNAKAPTADPTFTGTVGLPSTTSIGNVSSTELGYLDGVSSAIQTQLNTKAPTADPTFTGTVTLPSTTAIGNVSSTELSYLDGVSSAIQTQLNTKASTGKAIAMAIVFGG